VITTCVVPLSSRRISFACAGSSGFPTIMSPNATTVSAARTTSCGNRATAASAFAAAIDIAASAGSVPWRTSSSSTSVGCVTNV
jgi:hypothetical protein